MADQYLFKSERLGFRKWISNDLTELAAMNADEAVMEHFPATLSQEESAALLDRLQLHYTKNGYTYFATEVLETGEFIGFIGLAYQEYETEFTPATDIGWRLKPSAWGKGFATEGAKRCLQLAFDELKLKQVISTCTQSNTKSARVMQKIGMKYKGTFIHPKLVDYPDMQECIWYAIDSPL